MPTFAIQLNQNVHLREGLLCTFPHSLSAMTAVALKHGKPDYKQMIQNVIRTTDFINDVRILDIVKMITSNPPNTWLWKAIKEKKERLFQETYVAMEVFNTLQPGPDGFLYKALLLENWKKPALSLDAYRLAYAKYPNEEKVQHVCF